MPMSTSQRPRQGFELRLVGQLSGVLPRDTLVASLPVDELRGSASRANKVLHQSLKSCGDAELDQELWRKTMTEREVGWLKGPISWDELEPGAVVSPRFGSSKQHGDQV